MTITKLYKYIAIVVMLLTISQFAYSQDEGRQVFPLERGRVNSPIEVDGMAITLINLFVQDEPINNNAAHMELQMKVEGVEKSKPIYIGDYTNRSGKGGINSNYPMAIGKYTYALEKDAEGKVLLVVEPLDFGKEFYLNVHQVAKIGDFKINYTMCIIGQLVAPQGGNDASYNFGLSDGESKDTMSFGTVSYEYEGEILTDAWKDYRVYFQETSMDNSVRLKVDKILEKN